MHARQTQYLTPPSAAHLSAHHSAQPTSYRLPSLIDQHTSIVLEPHHAAIRSLVLLLGAYDDGVPDVAAADFVGCGDRGGGVGGLGAKGALFLDDDYYAVA